MSADARENRRIETALFLVSLFTYAYFYQGADQSTAARFDPMRSLLERHSLWIDGYCGYNTADIVHVGGHYYSVKAPGTSFLGLVPWKILTWLLGPIAMRNAPLFWAIVTWLTTALTVGLLVACAVVVMYRMAGALGASAGRSAGVALVLGFGTILFPYATEMTGEPVAAFCLLTSFYLLATFEREPGWERAIFAGLLAGWAVLCDFPSMMVATGLAVYALWKLPRKSDIGAFAAGAATVAGILLAYNWLAFGSPFFLSSMAYESVPGNRQFPEQMHGFVGITYPQLRILWDILIDPQRGLFFCNPILLLAIPGFVYFYRRTEHRAEFALTAFAVGAFIVFNASFGKSIVSWGGGTATGPRQMTPATPFMVLPLVFLPEACDVLIAALAAVSALAMLAATATNPHFPYEYGNPVRDFAMQHYFRADLSLNRDGYFNPGPVVGDSVAFNLGKLARLPGPMQLIPLALAWLAAGLEIAEDIGLWRDRRRALLGSAVIAVAVAVIFAPPMTAPLAGALMLRPRHGLLGRYYVGCAKRGERPRLERVDPEIDFENVAELGAMPFPSCVVWTGSLLAPRAGVYHFIIDADDSGWLRIDGKPVIADPGFVTRRVASAVLYLDAGPHRIEVGERNVAGDAAIRLYWWTPDDRRELVPSRVLFPGVRGPAASG